MVDGQHSRRVLLARNDPFTLPPVPFAGDLELDGLTIMGRSEIGITPQEASEEFGFETVEEFVAWLSTLDFGTMSALLEGLIGG